MTDPAGPVVAADPRRADTSFAIGLLVAGAAGALLALTARANPVALVVGVGVVQAALVLSWVFSAEVPGRVGAVVVGAAASGAADTCVSVWPHSRLGTLVGVVGVAAAVLFVHQVIRGAARIRLVESLGMASVTVVATVGLAALIQLRHEWLSPTLGGKVVAGVVAAGAAALIVGYLVDMITPAPHFDPRVPRGLLAVIGSAGVGGSVGHLLLRTDAEFINGRGAFVGAAIGALAGLLAVAVSFALSVPASTTAARRLRPIAGALVPLGLIAPIAYLLCLAVRA